MLPDNPFRFFTTTCVISTKASWSRSAYAGTESNTVEAWEKYLADYPASRSAGGREAKQRLNMAKHSSKIELGPTKMERVNLAENPETHALAFNSSQGEAAFALFVNLLKADTPELQRE